MAYTVQESWVRQYVGDALHLAAQRDGRLRDTVYEKAITGRSLEIDRIGAVDAVTKATRHANTPEAEVPHSRRRNSMSDKHWAEMIDKTDVARMLLDPQVAYMAELVGAYNRDFDDVIIAALGGAATQVDSTDTETNVVLPASQIIANGGTGMTVDKIRAARRILKGNEVDMNYEDCFIVLTAQQEQELLSDPVLTSSDYSNIQRLIDGDINGRFMGFKFRQSERLPASANVRDCFAYTKKAICLGVAMDMDVTVNDRPDRSNSKQIYAEWTRGAVRVEEAQVVKIEALES